MPPTTDLQSIGGPQFDVGVPGEIAGPIGAYDSESRINESATALDFGDVACRGVATTPGTMGNCKPMASGALVVGITILDRFLQADSNAAFKYAQYKTVKILTSGWIWAMAAEDVVEGNDCIGVVASPGKVGGTAGGAADGTTRLEFPIGHTWEQTVAANAVGLIQVRTTGARRVTTT